MHIRELFTTPPEEETDYFRDSKQRGALGYFLLLADRLARTIIEQLPDARGAGAGDAAR